MGVLDRFEKGLERAVNGAFAKVFRSEVQPIEIASALRRESDDRATPVSRERIITPNEFVVELGPADHKRLGQWEVQLGEELEAVVAEHVTAQRYHVAGPIRVTFAQAEDLDTGLFRVRSTSHRPGEQPPQPDPQAAQSAGTDAATPAPAEPTSGAAEGARPVVPVAAVPSAPPPPSYGAAVEFPPPPPGTAASSGPQPAYLDVEGRRFDLDKSVTVIGRGPECDIVLEDTGVSRRHAEVHLLDGVVRIVDLGSTNGTFVDGSKRPVVTLRQGSVITIGRKRLTFHAATPPGSAGQPASAGQSASSGHAGGGARPSHGAR